MANVLYFPFEPQQFFLVSYLIKPTKLLKHCTIVAGIVTCDITQLKNNVSHCQLKACEDYFMCDTNAVKDLEQGSPKPLAIVCVIEFRESEQCTFQLPDSWAVLLNPMARNSKVSIRVACLPSVTSHIDNTTHSITLVNT